MKQKVMVFGSFVVDLMGRTPHFPVPGETVKGSFFAQGAGGKGFNQGIAAHKSGADVYMITKLGKDNLGQIALDAMESVGLSKDYLFFSDDVATGTALIMVDEKSSQNEILMVPGACATITADEVDSLAEKLKDCEYLLLQLEVNQDANERIAGIAKESGVKVIVNTAPFSHIEDSFLDGVWLVTPNEVEAEELTGIPVTDLASADQAADVFFKKGVQNVVITLGGNGVYVNSNGHSEIIPAHTVPVIDTTGAGDAFNGGLLCALSEGKNLRDAIDWANALAALSVQRYGTTASMPWRREVEEFMASV